MASFSPFPVLNPRSHPVRIYKHKGSLAAENYLTEKINFAMNHRQSETLPWKTYWCASSDYRRRTDGNYIILSLFNRTCFHQMALVILFLASSFHQTSKCRLFFSTLSFTIHKMPYTIVEGECAVKTAMWGNRLAGCLRGHFESNFGLVVCQVPEKRILGIIWLLHYSLSQINSYFHCLQTPRRSRGAMPLQTLGNCGWIYNVVCMCNPNLAESTEQQTGIS